LAHRAGSLAISIDRLCRIGRLWAFVNPYSEYVALRKGLALKISQMLPSTGFFEGAHILRLRSASGFI
jgi:hypothetical protein